MNRDKAPLRIGGLELHPLADMALPLLLALSAAVTAALLGSAVQDWWGLRVVPAVSLLALLFALESYTFTTLFEVREVDMPDALRWAEMALMAALALWLGALPVTGGPVAAAVSGWAYWESYVGAGLLAYGWLQGAQSARAVRYLHPGLLVLAAGQERLANDDHARAFAALRNRSFGGVITVAVILGAGGWFRGDVQLWGWSWYGAGLLLQAMLAAGTALVAARLKQETTWALERVTATPAVFDQWMARGLSLLILPLLLALVLPAGPRIPLERVLGWLPAGGPVRDLTDLRPPDMGEAKPMLPPELMEELQRPEPWFHWPTVPRWVWYLLAALPVLWLLRAAARQLADRSGQVKGLRAVLAMAAAWYLALWKAVQEMGGGVLRQAVVTPLETVGAALFGEAGALGRYLPFRRGAPSEPRAALRYYFARLQAEAGRKGIRRGAGGTAAELGQRLAAVAPEQAGEVAALTRAYEQARYSEEPVAPEQASFARRAWVAIARAIKRT